jgi:glycosyltransferase involved in cell wall biosynthesis
VKEQRLPLVSVILCFLNEEKLLSEAIESVISQSYMNWELILVDDGSTDRSKDITQLYINSNPGKVNYTDHENHANRGLSISRNHGIAISNGDLIAFIDADDVWLTDKLKIQVNLMLANPKAAMLCEASLYWHYPWSNNPDPKEIIQIGKKRDRLFAPLELIGDLYPLADGDAPCPSGIIIWRDILLKHGGFEPSFTFLYEDQAFLYKIYLNEYIYISSCCNNLYRQQENKKYQDYDNIRKYFLDWLEKYIRQNNIQDKKLDKLLKKALASYQPPRKYTLKYFYHRIHNKLRATLKN